MSSIFGVSKKDVVFISENEEDWYLIYDAFNAEDFRPGSCMGCV